MIFRMRVAKVLAISVLLAAGAVPAALAQDPSNDQPNSVGSAPEAPAAVAPAATERQPVDAAAPQESQQNPPAAQQSPVADQTPPVAEPSAQPATASDAPVQNTNAPPAAQPSPSQTANPVTPAAETPAAAQPQKIVADDRLLYLPVSKYIEDNGKKLLAATDADDRTTLIQFYNSRMGSTLWVEKTGYNAAAKNLIAAIQDADSWGLRAADYKIPDLQPSASGEFKQEDLTAAEARLSLAALEYARDAHGDRINDPSSQLGTYLDRKPVLLERRTVIDTLATAPDKAAYLTSLNPKHEQFRRLREKLAEMRASKKEADALKLPDGKLLKPGMSDPQIAILRKRLKVAAEPKKDDGTAADDSYYDKALSDAVIAYKESTGIRPANASVTATLRRSLNASNDVTEARLIANMEEWRWMPDDLGDYYIMVNIPEFKFRVVSNGQVIHEERIVSGRPDAQSPIFSETMKTVVIQPRWNVPDSIKIKELLPSLRGGGDPLRRQGLVLEYNGRKVDPYNVDWSRNDIRNFHIYQPPGGGNALGVVKFLFPNKHAVYLHDTPSKSLFNEPVRAFSHGCMRVRNPVTLAELILQKDKSWDKEKVDDLVKNGPEENEIALDHPIPVHVTYFTAWVGDDGQVQTFDDVYGHEKRINLALAGRWNQIVKADEKKVSPEDIPDDGWGGKDGFANLFGDDDEYDSRGRRRKHNGGLGTFFKQVFGGF